MKKGNKVRNYVLVVLFVMIMISGIFAVSYSYYSSASSSGIMSQALVTSECLTLSTQSIYSTKPAYLYPIGDDQANLKSIAYNVGATTNEPVGVVTFSVKNNCDERVYADIVMMAQSDNTLPIANINYSYCSKNPSTQCLWSISSTTSGYCSKRNNIRYGVLSGVGQASIDANYSNEFHIYLETTYGGGADVCGMLGTSGVPIDGNSTKNIRIKYWLRSEATNYVGKKLSARFIMYTKRPDKVKNCTAATGGSCLYGDVNQDWVVDYRDVEYMFYKVSHNQTFTAIEKKVGDINFDGAVDNKDVVALNRIALPNYGI